MLRQLIIINNKIFSPINKIISLINKIINKINKIISLINKIKEHIKISQYSKTARIQ